MTRRGLLGTLTAAGAALLAACTGRGGDERLATEEREVGSPSGKFSAIVVADGDVLRPTIYDAAGAAVWTDDLQHVDRYFPGVIWESEQDVLWVLSTDHGNGSVRRAEDDSWERTMGSESMPAEIAEIARP